MTKEELVYLRLQNNGLIKPIATIEECVELLVGVQAQMQQFAEVSILNRTNGISMSMLAEAYQTNRLIKIWGQRGTVHTYVQEDWNLIAAVYRERLRWTAKYFSQQEVEFKSLLSAMDQFGQERGKVSKKELAEFIQSKADSYVGSDSTILYALLLQSTLQRIFFGLPEKPHTKHYIHFSHIQYKHWQVSEEETYRAFKELMVRYFKSYGPASLEDFCHWSGISKRESQSAFFDISPQLIEYEYENRKLYSLLKENSEKQPKIARETIYLLGKFDPLFVSYKEKNWIVSKVEEKEIWRSAARVEAVVLQGENVVALWRHTIKGKEVHFSVYPLKVKALTLKTKNELAIKFGKLANFWEKGLGTISYGHLGQLK